MNIITKKKEGMANSIIICCIGISLIILFLELGFNELEYEYIVTKLNECVSEAIMAGNFADRAMMSEYGYILPDCSEKTETSCIGRECTYKTVSEEEAFAKAYQKALYRVKDSLITTLNLTDSMEVTDKTPCKITEVKIKDFRIYGHIDAAGASDESGLSEGYTFIKTLTDEGWTDNADTITVPSGNTVDKSGIYMEVDFKTDTIGDKTDIPVRIFVGIRK